MTKSKSKGELRRPVMKVVTSESKSDGVDGGGVDQKPSGSDSSKDVGDKSNDEKGSGDNVQVNASTVHVAAEKPIKIKKGVIPKAAVNVLKNPEQETLDPNVFDNTQGIKHQFADPTEDKISRVLKSLPSGRTKVGINQEYIAHCDMFQVSGKLHILDPQTGVIKLPGERRSDKGDGKVLSTREWKEVVPSEELLSRESALMRMRGTLVSRNPEYTPIRDYLVVTESKTRVLKILPSFLRLCFIPRNDEFVIFERYAVLMMVMVYKLSNYGLRVNYTDEGVGNWCTYKDSAILATNPVKHRFDLELEQIVSREISAGNGRLHEIGLMETSTKLNAVGQPVGTLGFHVGMSNVYQKAVFFDEGTYATLKYNERKSHLLSGAESVILNEISFNSARLGAIYANVPGNQFAGLLRYGDVKQVNVVLDYNRLCDRKVEVSSGAKIAVQNSAELMLIATPGRGVNAGLAAIFATMTASNVTQWYDIIINFLVNGLDQILSLINSETRAGPLHGCAYLVLACFINIKYIKAFPNVNALLSMFGVDSAHPQYNDLHTFLMVMLATSSVGEPCGGPKLVLLRQSNGMTNDYRPKHNGMANRSTIAKFQDVLTFVTNRATRKDGLMALKHISETFRNGENLYDVFDHIMNLIDVIGRSPALNCPEVIPVGVQGNLMSRVGVSVVERAISADHALSCFVIIDLDPNQSDGINVYVRGLASLTRTAMDEFGMMGAVHEYYRLNGRDNAMGNLGYIVRLLVKTFKDNGATEEQTLYLVNRAVRVIVPTHYDINEFLYSTMYDYAKREYRYGAYPYGSRDVERMFNLPVEPRFAKSLNVNSGLIPQNLPYVLTQYGIITDGMASVFQNPQLKVKFVTVNLGGGKNQKLGYIYVEPGASDLSSFIQNGQLGVLEEFVAGAPKGFVVDNMLCSDVYVLPTAININGALEAGKIEDITEALHAPLYDQQSPNGSIHKLMNKVPLIVGLVPHGVTEVRYASEISLRLNSMDIYLLPHVEAYDHFHPKEFTQGLVRASCSINSLGIKPAVVETWDESYGVILDSTYNDEIGRAHV